VRRLWGPNYPTPVMARQGRFPGPGRVWMSAMRWPCSLRSSLRVGMVRRRCCGWMRGAALTCDDAQPTLLRKPLNCAYGVVL